MMDAPFLLDDGITEARGAADHFELFGTDRLDAILTTCDGSAADLLHCTLEAVNAFTAGQPAGDDRTLLLAKVR